MEQNLSKVVEKSMNRLRRNSDIWDSLAGEERESKVNAKADRRKNVPFRERRVYERESFRDSFWYKFFQRDLTDLNGRDGKNFRLRFTIPYQVSTQLLQFAEAWFPHKMYNVCGKEIAPVSLKLLGTLRMLGKGCSWDFLYELSGVSAEVHLTFIEKFCKELYPVYVHGPRNSEEFIRRLHYKFIRCVWIPWMCWVD